jgi:hypothetical protein
MKRNALALCAALAGGAVGHLLFFWIAAQGFYALILPGALVGVAAGLVPTRSAWVAVVCGLLALAFGLVTEYRFSPFTNVAGLQPIKLVMIAVGGLLGFWLPFQRREPRSWPRD